jgi:hypothetical protein
MVAVLGRAPEELGAADFAALLEAIDYRPAVVDLGSA